MTPTATTPAARKQAKRVKRPSARVSAASAAAGTSSARSAGHRATVRPQGAPSAPRRVSGPLGGLTHGRRVSGPARPATRPQPHPRTGRARIREPLGARTLAYIRALPDHQLLDRVVRGRAWIPLLGVLLAGIVAMQVEVLKLGAGMGRAIELSTTLQSRNELLRASVASLSDDQRIESRAATMGMVMPGPSAINFLSLRPAGAVQRAVTNIHAPNGTAFTAALPPVSSPSGSGAATAAASTSATSGATGTGTSVVPVVPSGQTSSSTGG